MSGDAATSEPLMMDAGLRLVSLAGSDKGSVAQPRHRAVPDFGRVLWQCRHVALRRASGNLQGMRSPMASAQRHGPEAFPSPGPSSPAAAGSSAWRIPPKAG